jgi:hypothetical protein
MQSRVTTFGTPSETNDGVRSPQRYFTTRNLVHLVVCTENSNPDVVMVKPAEDPV